MKVNLASFNPLTADIASNTEKVIRLLRAPAPQADLLVLPEAALCGCPLFDLFDDNTLALQNQQFLKLIAKETKQTACVLGFLDRRGKENLTAAAFIYEGKVTKIYDSETVSFLGENIQIVLGHPSDSVADSDADLILFLGARPYLKKALSVYLDNLCKFAKKAGVPCASCNLLGGGDGMIFDGLTAVANAKGQLALTPNLFEERLNSFDLNDLKTSVSYKLPWQEELLEALSFGLRDYVHKSGYDKVVFGVSGGIDSAFTAALAARALGGESVYCVSLPSYCTSNLSKTLAGQLAVKLGVNLEEVGVKPVLDAVKTAVEHMVSHPLNSTEQDLQSRLRTNILMALANEYNAMLISTDDKSETSVGSCVLYGDTSGSLLPIGDLYKSEIYELVEYLNRNEELIPKGIVERAPTSELSPNQKDEDFLPPYKVLDKILAAFWEENISSEADLAKKLKVKSAVVHDVLERINRADLTRRQTAPVLQVSRFPISGKMRPIIKKINL